MSHVPLVSSYYNIPVDDCVHQQSLWRRARRLSCSWYDWLCCCVHEKAITSMPWSADRPKSPDHEKPGPSLSEDVLRTIQQVDQQTSTLSTAGFAGFSARILDKSEYRMERRGPGSAVDVVVVQLVEIIKKPGQSLGLYLREGNGFDRPTGVFASRFGVNSELEKYGDIIRPGDEILSVNNVDISSMSIDDVVLVLSIPRRLLLRIRFLKNKRERMTQSQSMVTRPVVVFQKEEEERQEMTPSTSLLSHPTSTANTWLGKKARQQQQMSRRGIQPFCSTSSAPISPRQYFARHSPRLLDGDGEPLPENTIGQHSARMTSDTMSRGVRCIPSKVFPSVQPTDSSQPHHLVGQTNPSYAFSMPRSFTSQTASLQPCLTPLVDYDGATSSAFVSPRTPLVSARTRSLPTTKKMLVSDPLLDSVSRHSYSPISARRARTQYLPLSTPGGISYKSNSLPRRKAVPVASPRTVKWRNDVIGVGDVDSDGAISAPEMAMSPTLASSYIAQKEGRASVPFRGRTVDDIFSAQEYRNWAGSDPIYSACTRRSRWSHVYDQRFPGASVRSSSLPSRKLLSQVAGGAISGQEKRDILDRLHVSPLMNRRVPLRAAGPGFDVDAVNVNSLTGILTVQIIEGRGLRMPEKQKAFTEEMYCVLEVNEIHRARTGVSTAEQRFRWRETFEIDVHHAKHLHFFIYSWHPQFRHKLCHKGSLKLLEAFIVDRLNGDRMFALNLEPKGQLIVRVGFQNMTSAFRRSVNCRYDGVFGVPLQRLLSREGRETPLVLTRLLQEIESRGVEYSGLYILCGSVEKKRVLRCELEMNIQKAQLGVGAVPDTNVLACTVKDFLRELPEPLIPTAIYCMLVEAFSVAMPNDPQGNQQLLLRVIDCLPPANKNTLIQIMDHLKSILNTESHNGMAANRLTTIFGCLLFCSCDPPQEAASGSYPPKETVNPLDTDQAAHTLSLLINIWPSRVSGSESSSDSTDPTLAPNTIPESQC